MMSTWLADAYLRVERRVAAATVTDKGSLAWLRIAFGVYTMLFSWVSFGWLAALPPAFFDPQPLSLAGFLNGFPTASFLRVLDTIIVIGTMTLTIGLFTRASTLLLLAAMIIGNNFVYAVGKIDHGDVLRLCLLGVMAFSDWGRHLSVDSLRRRAQTQEGNDQVHLGVLALLVAFGFFTAGYEKALNWIDFDFSTNGFLTWLYRGYFQQGRDQWLATMAVNVRPLWLWEFADISAVLFELGFLVAMFHRRVWLIWLIGACVFHLVNLLLLNISFAGNVLVFLAFAPLRQFVPHRRAMERPYVLLGALLLFSGLCAAVETGWIAGGSLPRLLFPGAKLGLLVPSALCIVGMLVLTMTVVRERRQSTVARAEMAPDPVLSV